MNHADALLLVSRLHLLEEPEDLNKPEADTPPAAPSILDLMGDH